MCQGADFCWENKSDDNVTWAIIMIDGVWDHRRLTSLRWPLDSRRVVDWCGYNVDCSASREGAPALLRITPTLGPGKNVAPGAGDGICTALSWQALLPLYNTIEVFQALSSSSRTQRFAMWHGDLSTEYRIKRKESRTSETHWHVHIHSRIIHKS